jgi:hypothetical protein
MIFSSLGLSASAFSTSIFSFSSLAKASFLSLAIYSPLIHLHGFNGDIVFLAKEFGISRLFSFEYLICTFNEFVVALLGICSADNLIAAEMAWHGEFPDLRRVKFSN